MITKTQFFTTAKKLHVYDLLLSGNAHSILIAFSQIAEKLTDTTVWKDVLIDGNEYIEARYTISRIKQEVIVWSAHNSIADGIYSNDENELSSLIDSINDILKKKDQLLKQLK